MDPITLTSPAVEASTTRLSPGGFDLLTPALRYLFENTSINVDSILSFINTVWLTYSVLAYIFCIFLLYLYIKASAGKKMREKIDDEARARREQLYEEHFKGVPKNNRVQDMLDHISSSNPNDWKLAIIEADIILDELLKKAGYAGISLGERLRSISPNQLESLDDAWQAHKIRNQIAHGGADFVLTQKLAQDTIKQYRRVFFELGLQ